jgi:putative transposase
MRWDLTADHDTLGQQVRRHAGREPKPSAVVLDRRTITTTEQVGPRGCDGGKKIIGRKRHVVVNTLGLP